MSETTEAALELADFNSERERLFALERVQAAARGMDRPSGRYVCDCGNPIGEARRTAVPNAKDCIDCATFLERNTRRRA